MRCMMWGVVGAAGITLALLSGGCRPVKGTPFTYAGTIENEIDVPPETTYTYLEYRLGEPFEAPGGKITSTFTYHVPKIDVGGVPRSLDWTMTWYDPTNTVQLGTYSLTAPLKMRPAGDGYAISYKFKDTAFSGFTLGQFDYLHLSLTPHGGGLNPGERYGVKYTWLPKF